MRLGLGLGLSFAQKVAAGGATPPVFTIDPAITGTRYTGNTLTCDGGTCTGTAPITKTYQWKRNGVNIGSATSSTYVLTDSDAAKYITCYVEATNSAGSVNATSNQVLALTAQYGSVIDKGTALGYSLPSLADQILQDTLMQALVSSGYYALSCHFKCYAGSNSDFATLNWIDPTTKQSTLVNSPTYARASGFQGNGTSSYVNDNYNPNTTGFETTSNSHSLVYYHTTKTVGSMYTRGAEAGGTYKDIGLDGAGTSYVYYNSGGAETFTWGGGKCFFIDKTGTTLRFYENGSQSRINTGAGTGSIPNQVMATGAILSSGVANNFMNGKISMVADGKYLGATIVSAVSSAIATYIAAL